MAAKALVDTGPLLAILSPRDAWHRACTDALTTLRFPLGTSAAVLTELFHLVAARSPMGVRAAWDLVMSDAITVLPIGDRDLPALRFLMDKYSDRPMDFADATLVHLARREGLYSVFTIDHDDFETYRIDRNRRFRIVPDRRPEGLG